MVRGYLTVRYARAFVSALRHGARRERGQLSETVATRVSGAAYMGLVRRVRVLGWGQNRQVIIRRMNHGEYK